MNPPTKAKISATQRRNWESRRAATEQLEALRESHRRVVETLDLCASYVGFRADEQGDPLARFLKTKVEAAFDGMKVENIAASTLIADHTPQPDTGSATG